MAGWYLNSVIRTESPAISENGFIFQSLPEMNVAVSFVGDGGHMVPPEGTPVRFAYLKSVGDTHLAICYMGPFTEIPKHAPPVAATGSAWHKYDETVRAFFAQLGGANIKYSSRDDSAHNMTCHYSEAAVTKMPTDSELQAFVAQLTSDFPDAMPTYRAFF